MRLVALLLLFSSLLIFTPLFSGTTGKISGRVTDADTKDGLPGVNVVIEGTTLGAATDVDGYYVILNIPPGLYTVRFSFIGYQTVRVSQVRVNVDFTTRLDRALKVGAVELGVVEVQGERNPLVREDLTNTQVAVTADVIEQLPVDQISDVIRLQAGVVQDNDGALHIRGGRANEVAYLLNGISIANPSSNLQGVGIATNAVQEVSVSAGTFSAEYGNALSGVVNYVTKDGGPKYSGSFRFWTGDNFSSRNDVFYNIDEIDPLNNNRLEWTFGGPVPLLGNRLTFFTSGVRQNDKGHLYGMRIYKPEDILFINNDSFIIDPLGDGQASGDGEIVPMVPRESLNLTGKLTWNPSARMKITYDVVLDDGERFLRTDFRRFRFNPDGRAKTFENGANHSAGITHTLSNKTFYTLKLGLGWTDDKSFAFEDPIDPRYIASFGSLLTNNLIQPTDYLAGGTDLRRVWNQTTSYSAKVDVVSQVLPAHELKFGAEFQQHQLEVENYTLLYDVPQRPELGGTGPVIPYPYLNPQFTEYQYYERKPYRASFYLLDKMELAKTFILNVGLRYEYEYSNALYNPDLAGTVDTGVDQNLLRSDPKAHFSPRLSLSFPITAQGIIRFSYGHFYQNPTYASIYQNPRFEDLDFTDIPTFGNANLEPERSIQYEMGLQQQLGENFKADLTVFYKDVSNLIQTRRVYAGEVAATKEYNVVTNISYANVKGFTVAFLKRRSPGGVFSATLDYTFQVAEGAFDDPLQLAVDTRSGRDTEQKFVPLDFDRTHALNGTMTLSQTNNWTLSAIASLWTGTPYTPSLPSSIQPVRFEVNSGRRPLITNLDVKLEKYFRYSGMRWSVFMQIENVLDMANERFIHTSTGRSLTALEETTNPTLFNNLRRRIESDPNNFFPVQFIDDFYQREDWLSEPREIRWGVSFDF